MMRATHLQLKAKTAMKKPFFALLSLSLLCSGALAATVYTGDKIDGVPVISTVDEVPGLTLACAFTGHGFGISPIVGRLVAELCCGEKTTLDVTAFRYDRFRAWA